VENDVTPRADQKYQALKLALKPFMRDNDEKELEEAYSFAMKIYGEKKSSTAEYRIIHSLDIADIAVNEIGLGVASAISCLIHAMMVYNLVEPEEIKTRFGSSVVRIANGFARLSELPTDKVSIQSESFRKLFMALVDDIRIILIKIAHRLHDMRNLQQLEETKRKRFLNEVTHIYTPIAHRLGLYNIKKELEDLSMKYRHPDIYNDIAKKIRETESRRNAFINSFASPIRKELELQGIKYDIKGRPKSIASIWNKMQNKDVDFEEVYDLFAIRILMDTPREQEKSDCWRVYSVVTNIYAPNPKRLRDWISTPKASGYESLHTTVKGPGDRWVEVQIRSNRMDEIAELGQAAHWRYKEFSSKKGSDEWIMQIRDILENPRQIDFDELHASDKDRKTEKVYVFTPGGDLKELNSGATVLDFAFEVHSDVGYHCTGAKINGKIVTLKQPLKNGDKVEIQTSKVQKPKLDWLNFVTTAKAKNKIKRSLKEEKYLEADKGNEILRRKFRNWKIQFNDINIDRVIKKFKYSSSVDLYCAIYQEKMDPLDIKRFLVAGDEAEPASAIPQEAEEADPPKVIHSKPGDVLRISRNLENVNFNLAKCCNPIPGDAVFGFVTISKGITIHRRKCPNASQLMSRYKYRTIPVEWKENEEASTFTTVIKVTGIDKVGMMTEISDLISTDMKVNMVSVKIDSSGGLFNGIFKIIVKNTIQLDELLHKLEKIPGISRAMRIG